MDVDVDVDVEVAVGWALAGAANGALERPEVGTATLVDVSQPVACAVAVGDAYCTYVSQVEKVQTDSVAIATSGVGVIAVRERYPLTATVFGSCCTSVFVIGPSRS